jgi:DNA-directed RNA polymerase subunit E'/Rpb7
VRSTEDLTLDVGGLVTTTEEHVLWKTPRLRSGDEIQIRIVDVESADEPNRRRRIDATAREKSEEKYLEAVAKERGWKILKPKRVKAR